jgi:hypothetical protein
MRIPDQDRARFEELDEQRRRINDEFNFMVQNLRAGLVSDPDRVRLEAQHLQVRHDGILREMIDMLVY